jgi:predicted ArsR family transcriptional regulator
MSEFKHVRTLKRNRAARILPVLTALHKAGTATAQEIGISPVDANGLVKEGLWRVVGTVQTGRRGRPALVYKNTDKGRKRAKRAS